MSRERARLRAEREEHAAAERAKRARQADRRSAQASRRRVVVDAMGRRVRTARPTGILAARRRRRFIVTMVIALLVQVVTWSLSGSWWLRVTVALLTLLFTPVVLALMSDRRS